MTETARETWEPSALLVLANGLCRIDLFSPSFMGEILFFFFFLVASFLEDALEANMIVILHD